MTRLFAAFDLFPSPKGATRRMGRMVRTLAESGRPVLLCCLGREGYPRFQEEGPARIVRHLPREENFLARTEGYAAFLHGVMDRFGPEISSLHFRDVWSGAPLLTHPAAQGLPVLFEVNALASTELPSHYPAVRRRWGFMARLRALEAFCLARADRVVAVSRVGRAFLVERGVAPEKIHLIPNAADLPVSVPAVTDRKHLLYAGTLAPWQGVEVLLDALPHLGAAVLPLLACSTGKYLGALRKRARRLGWADGIEVRIGANPEEMTELFAHARLSVAPLARGDRNELQGCCPVKILESMAWGAPVIASDLPVCREIITHDRDGWLVSPQSPRALAHGIETLLADPSRLARLAEAGRRTVAARFSPERFREGVAALYEGLA